MALDGIFLYHLKNEISSFAIDSRVDKIHQPSRDEIILNLRSREGSRKLLISCNADCARIHFTDFPPENPPKPPKFCLLLRKRLTGAWLTSIEQNDLERIVKIYFSATNDLGDRENYCIVVEIMGKYSNIIFLDADENIIDSAKRIDENKSHIRKILPGEHYKEPPSQNKLSIFTADIEEIKRRMALSKKSRYKAALDTLKGVSPIICREIENGLTLEELKKNALTPTPIIVFADAPIDFSFMPIRQYGSLAENREFESFSQLLDYYFFEKVRLMRVKSRSAELFKTVGILHDRAVRKIANRTEELADCADKEKLKLYGDLISANIYSLQKGAPFYDVQNFYSSGETIRIPADPALTPLQNSQKYYKEYRKKQVAESKLRDFINQAEAEADYFDTVADSLSRAETDAEISAVRAELAAQGYIKKATIKKNAQRGDKKLAPMRFKTRDGFGVFVGRNNVMNDRLTMKTAKNYDTWFHTQSVPGSHVICETSGSEITETAIHDCALIAAYYSKARESSNVAVDYTLVKNIKKPNGAKPGFVVYETYKTEFVTPSMEETEKLRDE